MSDKTAPKAFRVLAGPKSEAANGTQDHAAPSVEQFEKLVHDLAACEASQPEGTVSLTRARVASLDDLATGQRVKLKTRADSEDESPPPANVTTFTPRRGTP